MHLNVRFCLTLLFLTLIEFSSVTASSQQTQSVTLRVATFNCSLNRSQQGQLLRDLSSPDQQQLRNITRIIRQIRPDILLLNEFDFDPAGENLRLFQELWLEADHSDISTPAIHYEFAFSAPVNTGIPTGRDLDHDGRTDGPGDAFGFGQFPGQYGMVLLSRYPIKLEAIRTFQKFLWKDMPGAALPVNPSDGSSWYSPEDLQIVRLSSKSHWDIPFVLPNGILHILASHPTPPAFDGPEDRNGRRNHDEIRFWAEYLNDAAAPWLIDDKGAVGPLPQSEQFLLLGDQNADPHDGDSFQKAILQILNHPRVNSSMVPASNGAKSAAIQQGGVNQRHRGPHQHDTADFSDRVVGNLRVDYVLPDKRMQIIDGAVFWPDLNEAGSEWISCSDHRLVWLDVRITPVPTGGSQEH